RSKTTRPCCTPRQGNEDRSANRRPIRARFPPRRCPSVMEHRSPRCRHLGCSRRRRRSPRRCTSRPSSQALRATPLPSPPPPSPPLAHHRRTPKQKPHPTYPTFFFHAPSPFTATKRPAVVAVFIQPPLPPRTTDAANSALPEPQQRLGDLVDGDRGRW